MATLFSYHILQQLKKLENHQCILLSSSLEIVMLLSWFASTLANLTSSIRTTSTNSTMNKWFNKPQLPNYYNNKPILELFMPTHKVSLDFRVYCNILQSKFSFTRSSSSSATSTRFLLNASTFVCFNLALRMILKLKSYSALTHLPFFP